MYAFFGYFNNISYLDGLRFKEKAENKKITHNSTSEHSPTTKSSLFYSRNKVLTLFKADYSAQHQIQTRSGKRAHL